MGDSKERGTGILSSWAAGIRTAEEVNKTLWVVAQLLQRRRKAITLKTASSL
jgi:hypothetical protein